MHILYVHQYFGARAGAAILKAVEPGEPALIPAQELSEVARVMIEAATQLSAQGRHLLADRGRNMPC